MAVQRNVAPALGQSHRRRRSTVVFQARAPAHPPLPLALERLFVLVSGPVSRLETSPDGHLTLREISILLGDVLDLLEEDQTILQSADELYEAALDVQEAKDKRFTCVKITRHTVAKRAKALHAALAGFRASLGSAKPSARARVRRLVW